MARELRRYLISVGILFLMCFSTQSFAAPSKLALIIGNSDYQVAPLVNPRNDAKLMAATLEDLGFEVLLREDLTYFEFGRVVANFGRSLEAAGEDAVGLFYYAGHAVQANGENYLIPVDVDIQDELDLSVKAVSMDLVMKSISTASNRLNLVFLDACRNNPFKALSRSTGGGLARIDAPFGTLISYSTAPGAVALDGTGRNSPYTSALARAIKQPGLTVEQALKRVRINVVEKTNARQVPWESSSLIGDFYFAGEPAPASGQTQIAALPPSSKQPSFSFRQNTIPGHKYGGDLTFRSAHIQNVYEDDNHINFRIFLGDTQIDGTSTRFPYFAIYADYHEGGKTNDNLRLLRFVLNQNHLKQKESRDADYTGCKPLGYRKNNAGLDSLRLVM